MSDDSARLDAVAAAICNAESYDKDSPSRWECQSDNCGRPKYRRMAQAAIDALTLTDEIGYAIGDEEPEDGQPDAWFSACDVSDTDEIADKLSDGRKLFHRLVSPWVRRDA